MTLELLLTSSMVTENAAGCQLPRVERGARTSLPKTIKQEIVGFTTLHVGYIKRLEWVESLDSGIGGGRRVDEGDVNLVRTTDSPHHRAVPVVLSL